ncbi:hypothetical protein [Spiroplasma endosymbiont of Nebria brevicollis]|uniref:hypothetical protein n=1 Tax=Spiroplasma endosymbiont of Nebria brevicollis TaxID=3066284 RepID=UPI00313E293D
MDEYMIGVVKEILTNNIVFECNNRGYLLTGVNLQTLPVNTKIKIYVYFYQKPMFEQHFAFLSREIKIFFIDLFNVRSVGTKTALKLLNQLPIATIKLAITNQNNKVLQQCKGIITKIATNVITYFSSQLAVVSNDDIHYQKSVLVFDTLLKLGFEKTSINN